MAEHITRPAGAREAPQESMTYEEYLDWLDDQTHAEWVEGKVIMHSPVSREHAEVSTFLTIVIGAYVDHFGCGQIFCDPFQMKTGPDLPGRAPDLLFVASRHLDRLTTHYLDGPADLVVEIISPDSRGRDRGEKYYEYEQGGVGEYWIIDPERRRAEFHRLDDEGVYRTVLPDDHGVYHSQAIADLWLQVDWLWDRPPVHEVMAAWGLLA